MLASLLLGACASAPPGGHEKSVTGPVTPPVSASGDESVRPVRSPAPVRLDIESTIRLLHQNDGDDDLLASDVSLGFDSDVLRYQASYALERGDILTLGNPVAAGSASPTRFGGQQIGQDIRLQSPAFVGSPVSLDVTTEFSDSWLVSGYTKSQRERANLNWSPGPATIDVQWTGSGLPLDAVAALTCNLQSTLSLPTYEGTHHSEGIRVSGAACSIGGDDAPWSDFRAQTFGLGYVWQRPSRSSEAVLSVIDPVWVPAEAYRAVEPGFELDLSHHHDFGMLSAETMISLRQAPLWESILVTDPGAAGATATDPTVTTDTSLIWNLPSLSVSASWATGKDRMWFTPEIGARSDSFGLALDLSRWMDDFMPHASPDVAMNWNWSEVRLPDDTITGNNSLRLDVSLMF